MNKKTKSCNGESGKNKFSVDVFDNQWKSKRMRNSRKGSFGLSCEAQTNFFVEERIKILLREFSKAKGKKILHCGCGTGQWSIPFAENGYHVTNIDLSSTAISLTEESFKVLGLQGEFRVAR